ncbi:hypothetical protein BDP27DRAFT_1319811 [Rhodocollybia butyracea]|uniref:Ubiquitin carboxyl-terminal hydrolase n=1 Tax=Rhodocollybia butyracea TaxID=206335 RepID=A0A9P5Q0T1_9AGAR|nr:hypothetical protein BDP27DRAFT_1319811 [Rhodocollybia butyracea]
MSTEDYKPCPHFITDFTEFMESKYKRVVSWSVSRHSNGKSPSKRRKITVPTCGTCGIALVRPFVCLEKGCNYSGCWASSHIVEHLKEHGHLFGADINSGAVFCCACDDVVHNHALDRAQLECHLRAEEKRTLAKVPREPFKFWEPSGKAEQTTALEGTTPISCQGRRGLLNLGQTCYMNVILQSFVHNPLLRNHFLGDNHNHKLCKTQDCACCEMDKLYFEIYSDEPTPYGPVSFLATTWRKSQELAGYAQHDAHEFFITSLNHIHSNCKGSTNISCNCIVHSTFAGQLQSDVKCERCGNVTSTVDPILDVSLELKEKVLRDDKGNPVLSLGACLRKYTGPEKLGPKEYTCSKCAKGSNSASKRLSFRKLPPVLSFQFKRFEHKGSDKSASAKKLDSPVRIPASLDMMPFTTMVMKDNENENTGLPVMYHYELFAVINHEGQMDNGHYTNFARFDSQWYRFDDDKVTHASLGSCLKSTPYMCFYAKKHLEYKPHIKPTYIRTRESEAVRERELEREKEAARQKELEDALLATV